MKGHFELQFTLVRCKCSSKNTTFDTMAKSEESQGKEETSHRIKSAFPEDFFDVCTYKFVFFFFYAAFGSTLVYLPLYFKHLGFNAAQVGVLTGLRPFLQVIGAPIGGFLADKFKKRKLITVIGLLAFVLKHLGILLVHSPNQTCLRMDNISGLHSTNATNVKREMPDLNTMSRKWSPLDFNHKSTSDKRYGGFGIKMDINGRPTSEETMRHDEYMLEEEDMNTEEKLVEKEEKKTRQGHQETEKTPRQFEDSARTRRNIITSNDKTQLKNQILRNQSEINRQFIWFLFIIFVCEVVASCMISLLDATAVEYLGEERNDYGKFRLWGSLGICIASITIGTVIQQNSYFFCDLEQKDYRILFYFLFGFSFLGLLFIGNTKQIYTEDKMKRGSQILKMKEVFLGIKNISFWMTVISLGIIDGFQMDFGAWFLDDLGTSPSMIGVATSLHFVMNALTFMVSNHIINRFGYMSTLSAGLCVYAVIFIGFSYARASWVGIVLFSLVGSVASLTWSCGVTYVAMVASPVGIVSTAEGFMNGIYTGIGISFGTIIGGIVIKVIDIRTAFRVDAAFAILVVLIFNTLLWIDRRRTTHEEAVYQPLKESTEE